MKPFSKIDDDMNDISEDYSYYRANPELYTELQERANLLIEEAYKNYMENFIEPLPSFKELNEEYETRLKRKERMLELNAPKIIIENENNLITELYFKIKNKKFISLNDPVQSKYRKEYNRRKEAFYISSEYLTLRKKIYDYNITKWNESVGIQE